MADGGTGGLFGKELVVDLFAGGGGASLGIARAYRHPDVAVNHNAIAIAVHEANHPETAHYVADVFEVEPCMATGGQPVAVLWASPDCRHHSKAKGGKPRSKKIRGLAWVVTKWAAAVRPRIICLENVEEFADWGPLLPNGQPCPARKGMTFRRWKKQLENLGYKVEHRELVAADYGVPTIRKRLYLVARCDGRPIVWPVATHHRTGAGGLPRWNGAAGCIDFDLPAQSIFDRKKQLADNTQRRIAKGLWRYVLNCSTPFIVPLRGTSNSHTSTHSIDAPLSTVAAGGTHHALLSPVIVGCGGRAGQSPPRPATEPTQTITAKADSCVAGAVLAPFLTEHANGSTQRVFDAQEPLRTQVAQVKGGHFALVAPHMVTIGYGERPGQQARAQDITAPTGTVVASNKHAVVAAHLTAFGENAQGSDLREPVQTVLAGAARYGMVAAHLTHLTHHGDRSGNAADEPLRTVTGAHRGEQALVSAFFEQANGGFYDGDGRAASEPLSTICTSGSNQRLVQAYLVKYYSEGGQWQGLAEPMHTVPTKDRMGMVQAVQVPADLLEPGLRDRARACAEFLHRHLPEHFPQLVDMVLTGGFVLVDITLRMLTPRELARAQGFPDSYVIERGADGRPITKTDQVRLIGNSVCPDMAQAIIAANAADLINLYRRIAA